MAVIKSKHAGNFTVLPNEIFKQGLTFESIGLLTYLLSLPQDWVVYKKNICKDCNIGREKLDRMFNELSEKGYIISVKKINAAGQFEYKHIVYDRPFNGEPNNRCSENRSGLTANGSTDNGKPAPILNTNLTKETILKDNNNNKEKKSDVTDLPPHINFALRLLDENDTEGVAHLEALEYQTKIKITKEQTKEFRMHLVTENKKYDNFNDWVRHFRNWLNTKPQNKVVISKPHSRYSMNKTEE